MTNKINITDSEWEVMRVIWSQQITTSREIIKILENKMNWRPTTIKTLLARLVKKELVGTEKEGNRYIYYSLVSEIDSWKSASNALFGQICAKKMGGKIALLIKNSLLSYDDLNIIQTALNEKEQEAVDEVPCDCIYGQCHCATGTCHFS